jgi:hypothetical protein
MANQICSNFFKIVDAFISFKEEITMRVMKSSRIELAVFLSLFLLPTLVFGQLPNHTYPRIAIWQWAGAMPDWYARFDLAYTRTGIYGPGDKAFIDEVRRKNPSIIWLPTTEFHTAHVFIENFPDEWYVVDSHGRRMGFSGDPYGEIYTDLSDLGVRVNGQRFIEWYPRYLRDMVNSVGANGMATDGLYARGHLSYYMPSDVDLDRNGINDITEHGKGWVIDRWANGVELLLNKLRAELGPNKAIMINSGSGDTPGISFVNGYVHEYDSSSDDWYNERIYWLSKFGQVYQPPVFLQQSNTDARDPRLKEYSHFKNYLPLVRFLLVKSMLFGRYFTFEHTQDKAPDHYWNNYYDEFDLDVGYPTGPMQEVKKEIWIRFFDGGVAIANFSGNDVIVADQDLRALAGYDGPYYRFLGSQDMALNGNNAVNNGQRFSSVNLSGHKYLGWRDAEYTAGDGVILVKSLQTVVSDIIIDNVEAGTSPASESVTLTGGFAQQKDGGDNCYSVRPGGAFAQPVFAVASPSSGEAVFTPNVGVAGKYEVYEWHGSLNRALASNAAYIINHADGSTTKIVNQQINEGQWNSLGVYTFKRGASGNVTISSTGANGSVMADAVKFVFRDGNASRDTVAPASPKNVKVQQGN